MFGICLCLMKNGCFLFNVRMEKYKIIMKILRSFYIDFWSCLNIKKVKLYFRVFGK